MLMLRHFTRSLLFSRKSGFYIFIHILFFSTIILFCLNTKSNFFANNQTHFTRAFSGDIRIQKNPEFSYYNGEPRALFSLTVEQQKALNTMPEIDTYSQRLFFDGNIFVLDKEYSVLFMGFQDSKPSGLILNTDALAQGAEHRQTFIYFDSNVVNDFKRLNRQLEKTPSAVRVSLLTDGIQNSVTFTKFGTYRNPLYYFSKSNISLMSLEKAREITKLNTQINEIAITVQNPKNVTHVMHNLRTLFGPEYVISTWETSGKTMGIFLSFYRYATGVVLFLLCVMAAIFIINVTLDQLSLRTKDTAILFAVGVRHKKILSFFLFEYIFIFFCATVCSIFIIKIYNKYSSRVILDHPIFQKFNNSMQLFSSDVAILVGINIFYCIILLLISNFKIRRTRPMHTFQSD